MKILLSLISLIFGTQLLTAGLVWEQKHIKKDTVANAESLEAIFKFKNEGESAITIKEVKPSCGCTTADLDKKVYEAGESGEIKAIFKIGNRVGQQRKTITVKTDDKDSPKDVLILETHIPELLKIQPRLVYWKQGDEVSTKSVTVTVSEGEAIEIKGVTTSNDNFNVELKTVEAAKRYEVVVTPKSTADRAYGIIKLDGGEMHKDLSKKYKIFSYVK